MDVRYINPFVASIRNTFETMCGLKVAIGKPGLKTEETPASDVAAIIGFSGDAAGSVALCLVFEAASKIATSFAGTEITPQHPDFGDALGELANMVAGGAKAKLDGLSVNISLPSVVIGERQRITASRTAPRLMIPCSTDAGSFHVEVGMELSKTPKTAQPATVEAASGG
jgi:chemotaxis protein CheX